MLGRSLCRTAIQAEGRRTAEESRAYLYCQSQIGQILGQAVSDNWMVISVMVAAIVCSIALPLSILFGCRAISGKVELSRTLSLALIISICCWPLFFGLFMQIKSGEDALKFYLTSTFIIYLILLLPASLIIAPVSLFFGIGMLFVYLFGGTTLSLKRVIILFAVSWIREILFLYATFSPE
jgi:hypothetical protein